MLVAGCRSEFEVHANVQRQTDFVKKTAITASRKPEISITVPGNCFWELDFVAGAL